jgi:hypothetical protein
MRKFFGREPRYSREEIERQAQEAIDARVGMGRPPAEDWQPLEARLEEIDYAIVARGLPEPAPLAAALPPPEVRAPAVKPAPARARRPVAARPAAD